MLLPLSYLKDDEDKDVLLLVKRVKILHILFVVVLVSFFILVALIIKFGDR